MWILLSCLMGFYVYARQDIVEDPANRGEVPWEKMNTSPNPTPERNGSSGTFHGTLKGKKRLQKDSVDKEEESSEIIEEPIETKRKDY